MQQAVPRRPFPYALLISLLLVTLAIALGAYNIWRLQTSSGKASLNDFGLVAPFSLISSNSQAFSDQELKGAIWIADFVFTSCQNECPLMSAEMAKIQQAARDIKLVSFSVDPEFDQPKILAAYARKFQADPQRWFFLTGQRAAIKELSMKSFHLGLEESQETHHHDHVTPHSNPFLHSQKFVLVDRRMHIRGYYDSNDPQAIKQLLAVDLPRLRDEGR